MYAKCDSSEEKGRAIVQSFKKRRSTRQRNTVSTLEHNDLIKSY